MKGKICVVTGATSGIGKAIATGLAEQGARVVMAGHEREQGERALAEVADTTGNEQLELEIADFSTLAAVRSFAQTVRDRHDRVDVLVNNAGVLRHEPSTTPDGLDDTWAVNYYAPFLLTHLLLDRLGAAPQGRIVNTASIAHRWGRLDRTRPSFQAGVFAYFDTKLAVVVFTRSLAERLPEGVTANCFHPGVIGTDLAAGRGTIGRLMRLSKPWMKRPEDGARTGVFLASAHEVAPTSGEYFVNTKVRRAARRAHDEQSAARLWERSVGVTGVG